MKTGVLRFAPEHEVVVYNRVWIEEDETTGASQVMVAWHQQGRHTEPTTALVRRTFREAAIGHAMLIQGGHWRATANHLYQD